MYKRSLKNILQIKKLYHSCILVNTIDISWLRQRTVKRLLFLSKIHVKSVLCGIVHATVYVLRGYKVYNALKKRTLSRALLSKVSMILFDL